MPTAESMLAPSGMRLSMFCGRPKSEPTPMFSEPERERWVELRISAFSSISMTTVMMSPRLDARRSPRSDA